MNDFHEYNARPYQRLSVLALHNLHEFSDDREVRLAACNILDYLAAKYAVSSDGLRRAAPFHRRDERGGYTPFYGNWSDEETWRFLLEIGNTATLQQTRYGRLDPGAGEVMVRSAAGDYRVPDLVADLIVDPSEPYFQRFRHEGVEVYARGPGYLLSAGGINNASYIFGIEASSPLPTTLMPTAAGADRGEFIRIDGHPSPSQRINTCVAPGFACGLNPLIPPAIPAGCLRTSGAWTFVNLASTASACARDYGLFVAMLKQDCVTAVCKQAGGDKASFGFFEVVEAKAFHASFDDFVRFVLANNGTKAFASEGPNAYDTSDGRRIVFVPNPGGSSAVASSPDKWRSGILRIDTQKQPDDIQKWRLADGPDNPVTKQGEWIIRSEVDQDGHEIGCVMIENRRMKKRLVLDLSKVEQPRRAIVDLPSECRCPLTLACPTTRCGGG